MTRGKKNKTGGAPIAHDWKNNPVIVACGSAAATIFLCIAVVTQVVIPTQTAKLEIEALKAREESRTLQSQLEKAHDLETKIASLEKQVDGLGKQLEDARTGSMFTPGSPYPNGLGVVRVGNLIGDVHKQFPPQQIEKDSDDKSVRVRLDNSPFSSVTYSYSRKDPRQKIISVSFALDYQKEFADNFLRNKLTEALGAPIQHPEGNFYRWKNTTGADVYMLDQHGYLVMAPAYLPALWPD